MLKNNSIYNHISQLLLNIASDGVKTIKVKTEPSLEGEH